MIVLIVDVPLYLAASCSVHDVLLYRFRDQPFVGLSNYRRLIAEPLFIRSATTTLVFTVWTPVLSPVLGLFGVQAVHVGSRLRRGQLHPRRDRPADTDGCGAFRLLWKVALPITMPGITAAAILLFIISWNEFLFALFLGGYHAQPLTVGMSRFVGGAETIVEYGVIAAYGSLVVMPVILFVFRRQPLDRHGHDRGSFEGMTGTLKSGGRCRALPLDGAGLPRRPGRRRNEQC